MVKAYTSYYSSLLRNIFSWPDLGNKGTGKY
jgi:hypothetical protein